MFKQQFKQERAQSFTLRGELSNCVYLPRICVFCMCQKEHGNTNWPPEEICRGAGLTLQRVP